MQSICQFDVTPAKTENRSVFKTVPALTLLLVLGFVLPAIADTVHYQVEYEETGRYHSDSESIGSKTSSINQELSLKLAIQEGLQFLYQEQHKDWRLFHPDGTEYLRLVYRYHKPRLTYRQGILSLNASLQALDLVRREPLYHKIEADDRNRFIMPALAGDLEQGNLFFNGGMWYENDFQTYDAYQYSIFIYLTKLAGVGYRLTDRQQLKLSLMEYDRIYPADYDLEKKEIHLQYRFIKPWEIEEKLEWREFSVTYKETQYETVIQKDLSTFAYLKFWALGLTHFFNYGLTATDYYSTYQEGVLKYTLIEEEKTENDLTQTIEYSGFTRISETHFFFSWKYALEDSILQNANLEQSARLQLTYAF